jgi:prophage antirepressor-like protein
MERIVRAIHRFEERRVTTLTYKGRPAWVAREVGSALGYANGGKRFTSSITGEWGKEFVDGKDFAVLLGSEAALLQQAMGAEGPDPGPLRSNRGIVILFESGLYLALARTEKEAGIRFRRFLADEVMPQLARTGRYAPKSEAPPEPRPEPTSTPTPRAQGQVALPFALVVAVPVRAANRPFVDADRERRLAAQHGLRLRKFESASLRETVRVLHDLEQIDQTTRVAYEVAATEIALGRELPELRPVVPERWYSPTQIAARVGATPHAVGLALTRLGLRGAAGLSRQVMTKARGHDKTVFAWVYNDEALSRILAFFEDDEHPKGAA